MFRAIAGALRALKDAFCNGFLYAATATDALLISMRNFFRGLFGGSSPMTEQAEQIAKVAEQAMVQAARAAKPDDGFSVRERTLGRVILRYCRAVSAEGTDRARPRPSLDELGNLAPVLECAPREVLMKVAYGGLPEAVELLRELPKVMAKARAIEARAVWGPSYALEAGNENGRLRRYANTARPVEEPLEETMGQVIPFPMRKVA